MYLKIIYSAEFGCDHRSWGTNFQLLKPIEIESDTTIIRKGIYHPNTSYKLFAQNSHSIKNQKFYLYYLECNTRLGQAFLDKVNSSCMGLKFQDFDKLLAAINATLLNLTRMELAKLRIASYALTRLNIQKDIKDIVLSIACEDEALLPEQVKRKLR